MCRLLEEKSNDNFALHHTGSEPPIPPAPSGGAKESFRNCSQQHVQSGAIFSSSHAESYLPFETRAKDRINEQTSHKKVGVADGFSGILFLSTTTFFLKLPC